MEKLGAPPDLKVEIHKRSIFSVYDENYSDAVLPKEKPRMSYPETNLTQVFEFNPKDVPVKSQPIDYLKGERDGAAGDKAQRAIRLAADVNDLMDNHQFEGAEILLGRKLREDEIQDQFVKDLMKPKVTKEQKILKQADEEVQADMARVEAQIRGEASFSDDEDQDDGEGDIFVSPQKLPDSPRSTVFDNDRSTEFAETVIAQSAATGSQPAFDASYDPSVEYSVAAANALLKEWRKRFPELRVQGARGLQQHALFRGIPSRKEDINARLYVVRNKIRQYMEVGDASDDPEIDDLEQSFSRLPTDPSPSPSPQQMSGTGISDKQRKAGWRPFGPRFLINEKKLKNESKLAFIYPNSGQKPAQLRNQELSPAMQAAFLSYLNNEPMDVMSLTPEENEYLRFVWTYAKIAKPVHKTPTYKTKPKQYVSKKDLQTRIKVLLGEFSAGNDSPEIFKELNSKIKTLMQKHPLTPTELINYRKILGQ